MRRIEPKYTIGSLIEELKKLDQNLPVMMSRDQEGNGFSSFCDMGVYRYDFENDEIRDDDETEFDRRALVLWP